MTEATYGYGTPLSAEEQEIVERFFRADDEDTITVDDIGGDE